MFTSGQIALEATITALRAQLAMQAGRSFRKADIFFHK
jgi:hypothetical protein